MNPGGLIVPNSISSTQENTLAINDQSSGGWANSPAAQALKKMQANPRVKYVVVIVPADACPACQNLTGTYPKDQVPPLPYDECSHPAGCCAFYLPYLDEIYP
jgi:hypothetical protein